MSAVAFDTLKLARTLRDTAKMSQEQAEGVADALAEAMSGAELATKGDLRELELRMDGRFKAIEGRFDTIEGRFETVDGRFETLNERIERRAAETEGRLIKWLIGTAAAAILTIIGAAWTIIRYLPPGPPPGH